MKSLFLKIFLSFWLVVALLVVVAILVTVATRPTRQISAIEAQQSRILSEAVSAYQTGGVERLHQFLRGVRDTQHLRTVLFRDDESLLGHSVPPWFVEVAKGQRRTTDTFLGRLNPHFQMLRVSMTGSDGHNYMLVTELPPGQSALFGPNGVPGLGILIGAGLLLPCAIPYFSGNSLTQGDSETRLRRPLRSGGWQLIPDRR